MSHLPITILAYLLNSISVLIDKTLLVKQIPNPLAYIFYISLVSLIALVLIPFITAPSTESLILSSTSTLIWTSAAYLMFTALKFGSATRVIPVIGTLIPILLLAQALTSGSLAGQQTLAVTLLILGLLFLTLPDWRGEFTLKEAALELSAAILFALSYLILKQAYFNSEFIAVAVYSRIILIPLAITLILIPATRNTILLKSTSQTPFKLLSAAGFLFIVGQSSGGLGEILITYSISLATPALVNSLQGVQYLFLFIFSLILSRYYPRIFTESWTVFKLSSKIAGVGLIGAGLYLLLGA